MGIEKTVTDRKGNEFVEILKKKANSAAQDYIHRQSKVTKSRRRLKKIMESPVQRLFEMCKEVFADGGRNGTIPSAEKVDRLRAVLDDITPFDVGLTPELPHFRRMVASRRSPAITYLHLYECDQFSIGIFCLPPSSVIPLHNHPGMTVFSKLLFGTMHIKSYDWVVDAPSDASSFSDHALPEGLRHDARLAKVKVDADFTAPCNTSILYPTDGGNMHRFTALTACAVLDVLGPPYSDPDGRHCTYYHDFPLTAFPVDGLPMSEEEKEQHAWLQERGSPEELTVVGAPYRGPMIIEN